MDGRLENRTLFRSPPAASQGPSPRCCDLRTADLLVANVPGLLLFLDLPVCGAPSRADGETRVAVPDPARRGESTLTFQWQGPSPLPQRHTDPWPAGGHSPRPAPDPPLAGASLPPGRALACVVPEPAGQRGTVVRGRGNAVRFLFPPGEAKALSPLPWQGPSPLPQRRAAPCQPGAKAPGQRPTRPRRALLARRVGRWPSVVPGLADLRGTVARRRGKRDAFPDPAQSGTPCPRTGKIFPAGRQADCFFSTLSGTIFAADVRRCRCQNPSQIASQ